MRDLGSAPASVVQSLKREVATTLRVQGKCQHICHYHGMTVKDNKFCLVMEEYDKSLAQLISEKGASGTGMYKYPVLSQSLGH